MRQLAVGGFVLLLFGCATGFSGQPPEKTVEIRAQERWDALRAGQFEKAFSYLTPSTRSTLPLEVFRGRISGASWIDVRVVKVVCEPEVCDVSVKIDYFVLPNLRDSQVVSEKWILDQGKWWFVYRG
jgi:hypothetical protein